MGRGLYIPSLPFPASRILFFKNPAFVSPWCHKIRLSYCRRKVSVNRYLPVQQMAKPAPFPRQPEAKVYTLDFAKQNRVPTGMLRAPIGNPAAKRCSLCNPSFPSQVHIQTAKGSLSSLLRKYKRRSVPMRDGLPFLRQPQFYHRTRNDKIKIDGDAIRGYTIIASFDEI